jgi:type IV secretory pathway TraG/TraD family ATPase VirD4
MAADLQGTGLRTLARWLQEEKYGEAAETLERYPDQVEPSMVATLRQMKPGDRTASSVSHTASSVLEFLQDGRIAAALDAPRGQAVDLAAFVRDNGTLYAITDNSPALGPVMAAIWDSIVDAAKLVAVEQRVPGRAARLRRPLLLAVDEMDKTMPSAPLDDHVAELRGWGVFILGATQNRARLVKAWGREGATTLCNSLQVHVILSMNDGADREYYERRIGKRTVENVNESVPGSLRERLARTPAKAAVVQSTREPLWEASMWSYLERGHALVVPTRGASAVVAIGNGWKVAGAAGLHARAEAERAAWRTDAARAAAERAAARGTASDAVGEETA